ncbi:MAG: CBASS oligonucleotide cyclase [Syntrophales bacterium]
MGKTISESFKKLKSNLEITDLQESTVSTRQQNIRDALENNLDTLDTFLTGSYRRKTMISPLKEADVDIFIVLECKYYHNYNGQNGGQAGLLDLLKRVLRKTYTKTPDISRNGQAVTIQFTDFMVDVVPGFNRKGGGYLIPNSISQTWLSTDPKAHVKIFSDANDVHNGDLIPLIKMIKRWNRTIGSYFNSFHLEVMALQILNNVKISDYPSGMRYFFGKGKDYVKKQNPDPAGYGGDAGAYLNTQDKINTANSRFETAYNRALKAEEYDRNGNIIKAIETWKLIFGDYFPSYG